MSKKNRFFETLPVTNLAKKNLEWAFSSAPGSVIKIEQLVLLFDLALTSDTQIAEEVSVRHAIVRDLVLSVRQVLSDKGQEKFHLFLAGFDGLFAQSGISL